MKSAMGETKDYIIANLEKELNARNEMYAQLEKIAVEDCNMKDEYRCRISEMRNEIKAQWKIVEESIELLKRAKIVMSNEKAGFLIHTVCHDIGLFVKEYSE